MLVRFSQAFDLAPFHLEYDDGLVSSEGYARGTIPSGRVDPRDPPAFENPRPSGPSPGSPDGEQDGMAPAARCCCTMAAAAWMCMVERRLPPPVMVDANGRHPFHVKRAAGGAATGPC